MTTCSKCGHPNVVQPPEHLGLKNLVPCALCGVNVILQSHFWTAETPQGTKYVCCQCSAPTKHLRTMSLPRPFRPSEN